MMEVIENNVSELWLEDDIIHFVYKKDCIISLDVAKGIVRMRIDFDVI